MTKWFVQPGIYLWVTFNFVWFNDYLYVAVQKTTMTIDGLTSLSDQLAWKPNLRMEQPPWRKSLLMQRSVSPLLHHHWHQAPVHRKLDWVMGCNLLDRFDEAAHARESALEGGSTTCMDTFGLWWWTIPHITICGFFLALHINCNMFVWCNSRVFCLLFYPNQL